MKAIVIPQEGPFRWTDIPDTGALPVLQELVGGYIEAVPIPDFVDRTGRSTAYINEEGKFHPDCKPNMAATDFLVPGIGLMPGDFIAGNLILVGFNPDTGDHAPLPPKVHDRANLIASESGRGWEP